MKKILIGIAVVVVVIVGAAIVAPRFVPLDSVKGRIIAQVKAATGRDLAINGDIHLSLLPDAEIDIDEMTLANAPGGEAASLVRLGGLRVKLRLLPLLAGSVEVARFVLVDPVINLEVDANGRANWIFTPQGNEGNGAAPAASSAPSASAPATAAETGGVETVGGGALTDLKLGDVRIENGAIGYRDARGATYRVEKIDLALKLAPLASPLGATRAPTFHGTRPAIEAAAATTPDAAAVLYCATVLTYSGLAAQAQRVAGGLAALGVRPGGRVAFWCPVDIQKPLQTRDPQKIRSEARHMIETLGGHQGGFIAGYYGDNEAIGLDPSIQDIACRAFVEFGGPVTVA